MLRLTRILLLLALGVALSGSPALAQKINIIPVPPHVKPQWTPLPNDPRIFYAPNVPTDLFRYRGHYYLFWEGNLFRSPKIKGPYRLVKEVPAFFYKIDQSYFKTVKQEAAPAPAAPGPPATAVPGQPEAPPEGVTPPTPETAPAAPEQTPETPPAGGAAPGAPAPE